MFLLIDLLGLDQKDVAWYQMMIRAVIVFTGAIILIRIAGMRSFGFRSPFDVVLSITIGAVLSRCISGHYPFFPCFGAAVVLALFHRFIAYLSYKSSFIGKLTDGEPIILFKNGVRFEQNMKKYNVTEQDLLKALHQQNLGDYSGAEALWLETDGSITVVKK